MNYPKHIYSSFEENDLVEIDNKHNFLITEISWPFLEKNNVDSIGELKTKNLIGILIKKYYNFTYEDIHEDYRYNFIFYCLEQKTYCYFNIKTSLQFGIKFKKIVLQANDQK